MAAPPPSDDGFLTLGAPVEAELRERGSRFLAVAVPVADRAEADRLFERRARLHREASHVVPAFRLRDGTAWASDAGEPSGSAGPPLLATMEGAGLVDVAAVVVRWFGGTRLGVGGLMRAYGGVLAAALAAAPRRRGRPAVLLELRYDAERTSAVLRTVAVHGGGQVEHGWEDGRALLRLALPAAAVDRFADGLRGATRGGIDVERRGATVLFDEPAPVTGR